MTRTMVGTALLSLALAVTVVYAQDQPPAQPKDQPPAQPPEQLKQPTAQPPAQALPPHPLDAAFRRGFTPNDLTNGLLNNRLFQQAVQAAAKAKQDAMRRPPGMVGPTPEQAARQAFLDVLNQTGTGTGTPPGTPPPK
jgi:pyruvate/2-oxoglutarate dehydrogenase complex dihydrolipoamide acyltransferase (E2) component